MKQPITVNFYTRPICPLCEEAKLQLLELSEEFPIIINEIDIYQDDHLLELYQLMIPVVVIGGEEVDFGRISKEIVREYLQNLQCLQSNNNDFC